MSAFWHKWFRRKELTLSLDERAELRQLTMRDVPALFELTVRNRQRLRPWMTWVDMVQREEDTREFVRDALHNFRAGRSMQMGIWLEGRLVGTIGLFRHTRVEPEAEIGYWIDESAEGKGLVTKATRLLTQYAFEHWSVSTVCIRVEPHNLRSRAVPERLGFRLRGQIEEDWSDGSHRTLMVYVMNASDFRPE